MELVEEVVPLLHTHVEADMARLLEGALAPRSPLMLLYDGAHRHVDGLVQQLVLFATPAVPAREVPLRLDVVLVFGDRGAARHLDRRLVASHTSGGYGCVAVVCGTRSVVGPSRLVLSGSRVVSSSFYAVPRGTARHGPRRRPALAPARSTP